MTVALIDASGLIHRCFHRTEHMDANFRYRSDGVPVGAVRDFSKTLFNWITRGIHQVQPTHIGVIFDAGGETFRHVLHDGYKANRPARPDDLGLQMPLFREAVSAFGLWPIELQGYEADDLIATYTRLSVEAGHDVLIVTSDKDMMQLVRPGVTIYSPGVGDPRYAGHRPEQIINDFEVLAKFGVSPDLVTEVQALAGDATDGIPGIPKVGLKTAAGLIREFGSAEGVIACISQIGRPKLRDAVAANINTIRLAHQLVTLLDDVPAPFGIEQIALPALDPDKLIRFFDRMEFRSMASRVRQHFNVQEAA